MAVTTKGRWRGVTQARGASGDGCAPASDGRRRRSPPWPSRRPPGLSATSSIAPRAWPIRCGVRSRRGATTRRANPCSAGSIGAALGGGPLLPGLAGPGGRSAARGRRGRQAAQELGFDRSALEVLQGVYQARGGRINDAEPVLRRAFDQEREPQAEVARELARIYLATYRLTQAAEVVERYRELMPTDPQPYLWSNEIGSRTEPRPPILIRNYRAALERDPDLDKARLGLAEQLSKDRRFDEAEQEYRTYLRRNPRDAAAMVGLGRNAFQDGDIEGATRDFEAALAVDPRQPDALKELAQLDMRVRPVRPGPPSARAAHADRPLRPRGPLYVLAGPQARRRAGEGARRERAGGAAPQRAGPSSSSSGPASSRTPATWPHDLRSPAGCSPTATPTRA